jgi:hypothetical protein
MSLNVIHYIVPIFMLLTWNLKISFAAPIRVEYPVKAPVPVAVPLDCVLATVKCVESTTVATDAAVTL